MAAETAAEETETKKKTPLRYHKLAEAVGGTLAIEQNGIACIAECVDHYPCRCGDEVIEAHLFNTSYEYQTFIGRKTESRVISPSDMLFFDTETTGLGGSGAVPFLIGVGKFSERGLVVRQYLLPDYGDEAAMLELVLREFSEHTVVISYNGAAFDIPLLNDRLRINRVAKEVPYGLHVDLLHSTRRLFRRRLKDCSLGNIERMLFGHERFDDIPGYLIPSTYFTWLSDEDPKQINNVLRHNYQDIATLAFLFNRLHAAYQTDGEILSRSDDLYSLSRLFSRHRSSERVIRALDRIETIDGETPPEVILLFKAHAFKRQGEWQEACSIWEELSPRSDKTGALALLELAKYYEHREKNLTVALEYSQRLVSLAAQGLLNPIEIRLRIERLTSRLAG